MRAAPSHGTTPVSRPTQPQRIGAKASAKDRTLPAVRISRSPWREPLLVLADPLSRPFFVRVSACRYMRSGGAARAICPPCPAPHFALSHLPPVGWAVAAGVKLVEESPGSMDER